jgi:RNA polymerase sigma factor (TIGR02999 family)
MTETGQGGVTQLLLEWRAGDESALEKLIPLVYRDLRMVARQCLRGERSGHTVQTTALVHEAYLRLVQSSRVQWRDRAHFFAVAAQLMRRVLVDEARKRLVLKRGGGQTRVALSEDAARTVEPAVDLLALDDALDRLARHAPRKARVVELRYFGGLTIEESAVAMGVSTDVVKREWRTARLWLLRALRGEVLHGAGAMESH